MEKEHFSFLKWPREKTSAIKNPFQKAEILQEDKAW